MASDIGSTASRIAYNLDGCSQALCEYHQFLNDGYCSYTELENRNLELDMPDPTPVPTPMPRNDEGGSRGRISIPSWISLGLNLRYGGKIFHQYLRAAVGMEPARTKALGWIISPHGQSFLSFVRYVGSRQSLALPALRPLVENMDRAVGALRGHANAAWRQHSREIGKAVTGNAQRAWITIASGTVAVGTNAVRVLGSFRVPILIIPREIFDITNSPIG